MARQSLGALLGNVEDKTPTPTPTPEAAPEPQQAETEALAAAATTEPARTVPSVKPRAPRSKQTAEPELPAYLRLVRKETRLREDQQNQLTLHARKLNRAKAAGTARITDNSLIRVAVDLLLSRIEKASGDDERAILESLNQ